MLCSTESKVSAAFRIPKSLLTAPPCKIVLVPKPDNHVDTPEDSHMPGAKRWVSVWPQQHPFGPGRTVRGLRACALCRPTAASESSLQANKRFQERSSRTVQLPGSSDKASAGQT